jgi:hypothetical protein
MPLTAFGPLPLSECVEEPFEAGTGGAAGAGVAVDTGSLELPEHAATTQAIVSTEATREATRHETIMSVPLR